MKIIHSRCFVLSTEKDGKLACTCSELLQSYLNLRTVFTVPVLLVKQCYLTWESVIIHHRDY